MPIEITLFYEDLDETEIKNLLDSLESVHHKYEIPFNTAVISYD